MVSSVSSSMPVNLPTVEMKWVVGLHWLAQVTYCMQGEVVANTKELKRELCLKTLFCLGTKEDNQEERIFLS